MIRFSQLVTREDHQPFVRFFDTAGSRSAIISDLKYFEPTTVSRQVQEAVLSIQLQTTRLQVDMAGELREPRVYAIGDFDLTPASGAYESERFHSGHAIAVSLPNNLIAEVLSEIASETPCDFQVLHERPHNSQFVLELCRQLLSEVTTGNEMGPLYADTILQILILELFKQAHLPSKVPASTPKQGLSDKLIGELREFIDQTGIVGVELRHLAAIAGMPVSTFSRLFKASTGLTPYQFVLGCRIEHAVSLLKSSKFSIAEIAVRSGFSSQSHMTDVFRAKLGVTPGQIRKDRL